MGKVLQTVLPGPKGRAFITAILLTILAVSVDLKEALATLATAKLWPVVLCALIIFGDRLLVTYRWHLLVRDTDSKVSFLALLRLTFVSAFLGIFGPGTVGIELFRIYGLARHTSMGLALASVLAERLSAIYTLFAMILLGISFTDIELPPAVYWSVLIAFLLVSAVCVPLVVPRLREFPLKVLKARIFAPVRSHILSLFENLDIYRKNWRLLLWLVALSVGLQVSRVLQAIVLAYALGIDVPYAFLFVVAPIGILLWLLPISIQGLGVREGAYVLLLGLVGVDPAAALTLSLLNFIMAIAVISLPGAFFYALGGIVKPSAIEQQPKRQPSDGDAT